MYHSIFGRIILAAGAFTLFSVAALWSFNALSELFGGPQAQYQHAIAATVFLLVLKSGLTRHGGRDVRTRINHQRFRCSEGNACEQ